jgi:hypothetical protein
LRPESQSTEIYARPARPSNEQQRDLQTDSAYPRKYEVELIAAEIISPGALRLQPESRIKYATNAADQLAVQLR